MVHGLAEQSGGRFVLQSHAGQGTTAELWLPVSETPAGQIEEASALPEETNGQRHALVVVAVDDDALVLLNTVAMLEDLGHTAFAAYSGKEALEILRREGKDVDLIITDQAMPQMTGTQLADAVNGGVARYPVDPRDRLCRDTAWRRRKSAQAVEAIHPGGAARGA